MQNLSLRHVYEQHFVFLSRFVPSEIRKSANMSKKQESFEMGISKRKLESVEKFKKVDYY
jgi:hypothetical protein